MKISKRPFLAASAAMAALVGVLVAVAPSGGAAASEPGTEGVRLGTEPARHLRVFEHRTQEGRLAGVDRAALKPRRTMPLVRWNS